ncbi:MAG: PAS domain S-box protein [Spirochaetia bacterium]|nr:PAS domain S-box protein [Spirochaetia bacterium]
MHEKNPVQNQDKDKMILEINARHSAMIANIGDVICILGTDGLLKYVSPNIERWFGWKPEELVGTDSWEFIHPEDLERIQKEFYTLVEKDNTAVTVECRAKCKKGTYTWIELTAANRISDPAINGVLLNYHDINERKQSERLLLESENLFKAAFHTSPDAVNINRLEDGLYIDINKGFTLLTGFTREDAIGKTSGEINIWQNPADRLELVRGLKEKGYYTNLQAEFRRKDGSVTTALMSASVIDLEGVPHIVSITRDISERKNAELALAAEKEHLAVTLRSIGDGVITTDINGNIVMLNRAAEVLTGWNSEEAAGRPLLEVFNIIHGITRQQYGNPAEKVLAAGEVVELDSQTCLIAKDGREIVIGDSGAPIHDSESRVIGVVLVFRDMTEKQKLEDSIQKAQKLESLGTLAGGIAHDFNNILSGIFGYIEMALDETPKEAVSNYLTEALSSFDRARALTRQLLTFAKGGSPIKKVEHLFPFVEKSVQFALSGSSVSSRFQIHENLWPCIFDKNQMSQVIDNVIINAQQAMPNGGTIEVSARNISLSEKEHILLNAGNYVKLSIKDQGIGIPREFLPRIFDPYYSTKSKGHGLGLATCYSIVERHGGCIDVESEPGRGSTFHLYLPASTQFISTQAGKTPGKHRGSGTFLVMDDEEAIRVITGKMLESFGYTVVLKESGKDAVDFFMTETKADRKLTGLIFDLTVPGGIGGREAIGQIRKICSETPVFVASGYSVDPIMANPEKYGFTASLRKPFTAAELSELLEKNLKKHSEQ